jgi:molybdopterin synthase sulfur carrier subunit
MIDVRFFGRLREELECAALQLDYREDIADLDALAVALCRERGPRWSEALAEPNIIRAINHSVIEGNATLNDGDEVAFFPPVTGG